MTDSDIITGSPVPIQPEPVNHYREAERLTAAYKDAITAIEQRPTDTVEQFEKVLYAARNAHAMLDKAAVHASLAKDDATRELVAELRLVRIQQERATRRGAANGARTVRS